MHGKCNASCSPPTAIPTKAVQYNVQTLKHEGDEIDLYTRFKLGKCAINCLQENRKKYTGIQDMHGALHVLLLVCMATMVSK